MNKKVLPVILIATSIFMVGCNNKQDAQSDDKSQQTATITTKGATTTAISTDTTKGKDNNATSIQNGEIFYGKWVIKKVSGNGKGGTYDNDNLKEILGKNLSFSKEQSSCFGDDASYLNNVVKNPTYKKTTVTADSFLKYWGVPISNTGISSNTVTEVEIDDAKDFPACIFFIKDDNTLILYGGGTFFELSRVK